MTQQIENLLTERLNETGFPFQEWCYEVIKSLGGTDGERLVTKEYPFTLIGSRLDTPGTIDLLSLRIPENDGFHDCFWTLFVIECKKSKPGIKNWCFIKTNRGDKDSKTYFFGRNFEKEEPLTFRLESYPHDRVKFFKGDGGTINETVMFGCEVNHLMNSLNRNQEEKIYNSILQSVHGCAWLEVKNLPIIQELHLSEDFFISLGKNIRSPKPYPFLFIPLVLTTADLYVAEFNAFNVNNGEINAGKVKWEKRDWLVYDFGLPDHLQHNELISRGVFIVNDKYFQEFYKNFRPIYPY